MSTTGAVRHHFDLSHCDEELNDLRFHVGLAQFPVSRHDHESVAQAARDNAVIGMMTAEQRSARTTHFADVPASAFPARRIRRLKLTYDDCDRRFRLRLLVWLGTYIPPQYRHRHRTKVLKRGGLGHPLKLQDLGIDPVAPDRVVDLLAHADLIGTLPDTAAGHQLYPAYRMCLCRVSRPFG